MISILLVDDEPLLRLGFRLVLESQPDFTVVGEAADGAAAISRTAELDPDVVVMDVRMPGMDGIEATREIVRSHPRSRVLILTTFDIDEYAFPGLKAGASGFLLKNVPPEDLISAIRAVAGGDAVVAPSVTRRLLDAMADRIPDTTPTGNTPTTGHGLERLTERELEVLTKLARGLSNAEIAEELVLSEGTVKTHVGRILNKLELRDRVQAVVLAYDIGLVRPT
ncbi:two-component system response regulator [Amycolatopsis mediterranei S699]|uniref:Two-component system response regulator n=2 Tax=Amycolatopsis mediterranei TaxID=33910 RepID=A0A0H3DDD5_AMYMU|nr:response regulator [Amycolatopsis mediterranei]ADJ48237.1 two-component system response regulator [Amycolatopsis mediterranei U32]AEK45146.1 two-component system response regulator [Amycolatopsis mediterranei S699]AFO79948.1 two-component system response regulator [Amycolatopsis mediterranei S699]AGT87076.1 two-component system response regulator [Amycolatopsis mediterranei RB]KDO10723.1 LuxR family transcriptional regulator [Amycolatopsis mediterranei]